ncbi:MAG: Mfa1 fimbrilin C-terminal domain-containing protein, partial [Duncaniella sp.]|nr:Mfa1 fimbrilin C-terminal domain-containing protein [Duncaniella sp.]
GIYFDEVPAGVAADAVTIREYLLAHQNIIAVRVGDKYENANIQNLPASATVNVVHPSKAVRDVADEKLSEELVTLQVEDGAGLYYKPLGSDEWTSLAGADENVLNYVNRQLMGMLRYAHTYTNGKCYFSIPIQHLGLTENTTNSPYDENNLLDWKKVRVGDFGLVRNHVYDINVTGIEGLASGINNLENPIVTPMNTYNYYIRYTLNVLNWRIVPSQNVVL